MPPPPPPLWHNNTYLIASLCALRLFTPLRPRAIARILTANFGHHHLALAPDDVRYIWETITAAYPPWFAHMAALRNNDPQVVGVVAMLLGQELEGNVPVDGEEGDGWRGVGRSLDVMLGRRGGAW